MASTYTVNLGIEKPATGEQSGTWGNTTNTNFDIIDQAINGAVTVTLAATGSSGSPNALAISDGAVSNGRNKFIEFNDGGDLGGTAYVQLTPNDAEKIVFIRNSLSGSRSILIFQGTYDAGRDLEIPAGVDMVVKFSGGGATATTTDVFTKLQATAITTPSLVATTADINGGSLDGATVGAASASTGAFTTLTASTSLNVASSTTVDGVLDEDNMASNSASKLATQQSIKAYVDSQVATSDTLAEVLGNGNTSGSNNLVIDNGQAITTNTVNETTAGSGVTIDSVLLKDDGVNATNLEITNLKANDGTAAGSIANSTGAVTITSFVSNSVDIGGGAIDGTTIGGSSAAAITGTTITGTGFVTTGNMTYGDNDKAIFGAGSDLQIFHDGSNSYISDAGTGGLIFRSNIFSFRNAADDEQVMLASEDGAVTLYYDNSAKLATASGGVSVTGDMLASGKIGLDSTDYITFTDNTRMDVYINNSNEFRFESDGDFHADGNVVAYSTTISDARLKEDVEPITDALDKVSQLNGYTFTYIADGKKSAGVIAQEVEEVLPSAIVESKLPLKVDDDVEYKTVQYDQLHGLLIEAIKELKSQIEEIKNASSQ